MSDRVIRLPANNWKARPYQFKLWKYLCHGGKRAVAIHHRRAGKDEIGLHYAACAAMQRIGNFVHCLPEYLQGRRAIWTAINPHSGKRRIDEVFPEALRLNTDDGKMFIRLINGSTWSVIGSDNYDTALVGTSVTGIVFSEYALANPSAWAYARPILEENNGWALFITTPRGRNHAFEMYKHAQHAPGWFCELLTARDTGAMTEQQLDEALSEYRALYGEAGEAMWNQEFMCDFSAALLGAIFSYEMAQVRAEDRVLPIKPVDGLPVHRAWDLGMRDDTAVIFFQTVGAQLFVLDCLSTSGASLEWWRDEIVKLHTEHGWRHGTDFVPHDAKVRELSTGRTRVETMQALGLHPMLAPDASLQDGINAVRRTLPLCIFHPRCEDKLLPALESYRREWDDEKKCFRAAPLHDWCSDRVDAMRYLSLAWRPSAPRVVAPPRRDGWVIPPPSEAKRGMQL